MPKTVWVCPNPYQYVNSDGVPCATFPEDPEFYPGMQRHVGAMVCHTRTVVHSEYDPKTGRAHKQTTVFAFDDTPVERQATPHYLQGIRTGAILAADEESARMAGVKQPLSVDVARAREQVRALKTLQAYHGEDADLKDPPRPL